MQKFKTRDGGEAVVFGTNKASTRCYLGAYLSGDRWIPCDWKRDGTWHEDAGHPRGLDLMLPTAEPATIEEA